MFREQRRRFDGVNVGGTRIDVRNGGYRARRHDERERLAREMTPDATARIYHVRQCAPGVLANQLFTPLNAR